MSRSCVSCPLCGDASARLWEGPRATHHCSGCGVVWVVPPPGVAPPGRCGSAEYYEQYYRSRGAALMADFSARLDRLAPVLGGGSTGSAEPRRWLDVGCGGGYFLAAAVQRGWRATGIDPSPAAIRLAEEVAPAARLVCGGAQDLPEGETYDVISFWDSMYCIPGLPTDLTRYLERLAPGGAVVVKSMHRPPRFCRAARLLLGWRPALRDDLADVRGTSWHFTPASLAELLGRHGLDVAHQEWAGEVPVPAAAHGRLSPSMVARTALRALLRGAIGRHESFLMVARKPVYATAAVQTRRAEAGQARVRASAM